MAYNPGIVDRSGEILAQSRLAGGMALLGGVSQGIDAFLKKKEEKKNEQEAIAFVKTQFPGIDDAAAKAGIKATGGAGAFIKFKQDMEQTQKSQQAASYAAMLSQGGGQPPPGISRQMLDQFDPQVRLEGENIYLKTAQERANLERTQAETLGLLQPAPLKAPEGFRFNQNGNLEPIPGGPAAGAQEQRDLQNRLAKEAAERQQTELQLKINDATSRATSEQEKKALAEEATKSATDDARLSAETTLREIQKARSLINEGFLAQGFGSSVGGFFGGTPANDLETTYDVIRANEALARIIALKKASPTGSTGFGALNLKELEVLQSRFAKLTRSASDKSAKEALDDLERTIGKAFPDVKEQFDTQKRQVANPRTSQNKTDLTKLPSGSRFEILSTGR